MSTFRLCRNVDYFLLLPYPHTRPPTSPPYKHCQKSHIITPTGAAPNTSFVQSNPATASRKETTRHLCGGKTLRPQPVVSKQHLLPRPKQPPAPRQDSHVEAAIYRADPNPNMQVPQKVPRTAFPLIGPDSRLGKHWEHQQDRRPLSSRHRDAPHKSALSWTPSVASPGRPTFWK